MCVNIMNLIKIYYELMLCCCCCFFFISSFSLPLSFHHNVKCTYTIYRNNQNNNNHNNHNNRNNSNPFIHQVWMLLFLLSFEFFRYSYSFLTHIDVIYTEQIIQIYTHIKSSQCTILLTYIFHFLFLFSI